MAGCLNLFISLLFVFMIEIIIGLGETSLVSPFIEEANVFYRSCDTTKAFSVEYGESFEDCLSDCKHLSDCVFLMFHHPMKQCALFDVLLDDAVRPKKEPICSCALINRSALPDRSVCSRRERFDKGREECVLTNCAIPEDIDNAELLSTVTKLGGTNRYKCKKGYFGTGDPKIVCQPNGTWSSTNFKCMNAHCPLPNTFPYATLIWSNKTRIGSTATYTCLPGFVQFGNPNISCQMNATWSTANFECSDAKCPPAKTISNAILNSTETLILTQTRYECEQGYLSIGNPEIRCLMNGSWTPTEFKCQKLCSVPKNVSENGHLVSVQHASSEQDYRPGTKLTYRCNPNYYGEENSTSNICSSSGYWQSRRVMCCMNGTVSYGHACYRTFSMGSAANYSEVTDECIRNGTNFVDTDQNLYTLLQTKGQRVMPLMLMAAKKSTYQRYLYQNCLRPRMNETDLIPYKNVSYNVTRSLIIENGWQRSEHCAHYLVNDWVQNEPNGDKNEDCIARGPATDFKCIDVNCEFQYPDISIEHYTNSTEGMGFTCRYDPPSV